MDEEVGVRLTRLRRRLSVEQTEDVSSPSTPTKKRASKLTKPALDNIAENAVVDSPKRTTRRSIAQEGVAPDDKVSTPAKKTRTKANTSLLSDSTCAADSPKPARVTRRNSIAGNEINTPTALTPVRRSRRLSKDCKSPDTTVELISTRRNKRNSVTPHIITEETEKNNGHVSSSSITPTKCSPKIKNLSPTSVLSGDTNENPKKELVLEEDLNTSDKSSPSSVRKSPRLSLKKNSDTDESSSGLLKRDSEKQLESLQPSRVFESHRLNKQIAKGTKKRSKSFTNLESTIKNDSGIYYSDNESRKIKKKNAKFTVLECTEIGDHKSKSAVQSSPKNTTNTKKFHIHNTEEVCSENINRDNDHSMKKIDYSLDSNFKIFDNDKITSVIITEDLDGKDDNIYHFTKESKHNDSCEPMEIDETIPEINVSIKDASSNKSGGFNQDQVVNGNNKSSSFSDKENKSDSVNLTSNNSKSTMVLSVHSNKSNSFQSNKSKTETPKSIKNSSINVDKSTEEKKNSVNKIKTDTPINNKIAKSLAVFTSTPVHDKKYIKDVSLEKKGAVSEHTKQQSSIHISNTEDASDEDEKVSSLLDNEAESAGDDYESGDSKDESERKYEQENEIPTKGESLDSEEEEDTDDSDYEKDSFVVSSDEEDNQLLSDSGHDLDSSDLELSMSKLSKEQYNKKSEKQQKRASKEMFEARHGKSKEKVLDSDSEESDIIFSTKNKRSNRLRLDSSKDNTDAKVLSESEITLLTNKSTTDKDPLKNSFVIKEENLENSAINNTILENIEKVDVDQDLTLFMKRDSQNPLDSVDEEESDYEGEETDSDDREISNDFENLLKGLNDSKTMKGKTDKINVSGNKSTENVKLKKNSLSMDKIKPTISSKESKNISSSKLEKDSSSASEMSEKEEFNNTKDQIKREKIVSSNKNRTMKQNLSLSGITMTKTKHDSIIDKLNLTNSGKIKKSLVEELHHSKSAKRSDEDENSSSDGIDFKLLFTQDENSNDTNNEDNFIPLKRSEASTNLLEKLETSGRKDSVMKRNSIEFKTDVKESKGKNVTESKMNGHKDHRKIGDMETSLNKEKRSKKKNQEKQASPTKDTISTQSEPLQKAKKRKAKDIDEKIVASSEKRVKIHRLPEEILDRLEEIEHKQSNTPTVTATSHFEVQSLITRKSKPSHYLEESIHIDHSPKLKATSEKKILKKLKVLPSISKAATSRDGCTSNFKVRVLKPDKRLDAKMSAPVEIVNFKQQRLYGKSIKRIATEELCRKQKKLKTTKF